MSCRMPECHYISPNGSVTKLDHDKDTRPGATFYYCSIHHVYHRIVVRAHRRLPQPLCGECAWLFFKFPKEAAKHPESDIIATAGPSDIPAIAVGSSFSREDPYDSLLSVHSSTAIDTSAVTMPLDRIKRPLLTIQEMLGSLKESYPDVVGSSRRAPSRVREDSGAGEYDTYVVDTDGDIIMQDNTSSSKQRNIPPAIPAGGIVYLPIRRSRNGSRTDFLEFIPYDNPAVLDVRPAQWHRIRRGVFLFRYTDYRGWPAIQPVADERCIKAYFKPLDVIEGDGNCDRALIEARWWCCWAQGITYLEPELRWVLTLIFDLIGFFIEKQRNATRYSIIHGVTDLALERLFWEGRSYLHSLIAIVNDMKEGFGIENLVTPQLPQIIGT
ncbi:uncharacterized protein F4812DRAFT_460797 [Daldinia caldariorum]|uniref:uncharacterized protein n=1 Tax=Daldinia caldariorum TaxID=326644 RepID=UPI00200809DD|nr:uncharacterized protein F4812DRAFT_460797 [Daldinia caldariorum]KAI1466526.1 hypothetical protein F4812DRAFT_460797 [Daldinia caldariorum]